MQAAQKGAFKSVGKVRPFIVVVVVIVVLRIDVPVFIPNRRQRHHPGDRPAEGPRPGPAQAHAHLLHGGAAVRARARVPAVPVRRGPRAHGAREAAESLRDSGRNTTAERRRLKRRITKINQTSRPLS